MWTALLCRTVLFMEVFHAGGHDEGQSPSYYIEIYAAALRRQCVPAALQHGGHHHCGALRGGLCPGGGGLHRYHPLSHHRTFPGTDHRLHGTDSTMLRCPRIPAGPGFCGQRHYPVGGCGGDPDPLLRTGHGTTSAAHEHTGQYLSGRLYLYRAGELDRCCGS